MTLKLKNRDLQSRGLEREEDAPLPRIELEC